jgi:hypothetical protein
LSTWLHQVISAVWRLLQRTLALAIDKIDGQPRFAKESEADQPGIRSAGRAYQQSLIDKPDLPAAFCGFEAESTSSGL